MIKALNLGLQNQRYRAYLRAVSIAVWVFLFVLWSSNILSEEFSRLISPLGFLANCLVGIFALFAISGSIVLWVSMIYCWRHFDKRPPAKRTLWFLLILFGFCFGARRVSTSLRPVRRVSTSLRPVVMEFSESFHLS